MRRVSVTVLFALVAAHVMTLTAALGACKTTLHGELVAYDDPKQIFHVVPQKWLFFSLSEIVQEKRYTVAKSATWAQPTVSGNRIFVKDVSSLTLWTLD